MKQGEVILTTVPQANGEMKNSPALILREMPSYGDLLVCGISKQLNHYVKDFDEIISPDHENIIANGLLPKSLIRLGFLAVLPRNRVLGTIGKISKERHKRLLNSLSNYLTAEM